ncbi:MAG TPA: hypothetical protein VGF14_02905 [Alphaproteobacteria bacterium]
MTHYRTAIHETAEDRETNALIAQWQASQESIVVAEAAPQVMETGTFNTIHYAADSLPGFQQTALDMVHYLQSSPLALYGTIAAGIIGMALYGRMLLPKTDKTIQV